MYIPDHLGWVKYQILKLRRLYILIELSDLIVFGYDLSDIQDESTRSASGTACVTQAIWYGTVSQVMLNLVRPLKHFITYVSNG